MYKIIIAVTTILCMTGFTATKEEEPAIVIKEEVTDLTFK